MRKRLEMNHRRHTDVIGSRVQILDRILHEQALVLAHAVDSPDALERIIVVFQVFQLHLLVTDEAAAGGNHDLGVDDVFRAIQRVDGFHAAHAVVVISQQLVCLRVQLILAAEIHVILNKALEVLVDGIRTRAIGHVLAILAALLGVEVIRILEFAQPLIGGREAGHRVGELEAVVVIQPVDCVAAVIQELIQQLGLGVALRVIQPGLTEGSLIHVFLAVVELIFILRRVDAHRLAAVGGSAAEFAGFVDGQNVQLKTDRLGLLRRGNSRRTAAAAHADDQHIDIHLDGFILFGNGLAEVFDSRGLCSASLKRLSERRLDGRFDAVGGGRCARHRIQLHRLVFKHHRYQIIDDALHDRRGLTGILPVVDNLNIGHFCLGNRDGNLHRIDH